MPIDAKFRGKLTPKQRQALPLLAAGKSGNEVASALGVHIATVSKWLNHSEEFQRALANLRRAALQAAEEQMQLIAQEAFSTLRDLLVSGESESVRLRAACYVLDVTGVAERAARSDPKPGGELDALAKILNQIGLPA